MKMSDLSKIVLEMKGRMPESSRFLLAQKIVERVRKDLFSTKDNAKIQAWVEGGGMQDFFNACEFTSGPPHCNPSIGVHDTDLAAFINRWMNVDKFRRSGSREFEPFTPDMNSVRVTLVEDLKKLAAAQKEMNGVTDEDEIQGS